MKRNLLIASLLLTGAASAQFTQSNEPAIGTGQVMYVCDTLTPDYAGMTGTGQTWDYSGAAWMNETKALSVVDPATTSEGASFPSATKAVVLEDFMTTYLTSSASARNSQGFSFEDQGTMINVVLDSDDELLMNYPFAYSNSLVDAFSGHVEYSSNIPCSGSVAATVDGSGTIILNGSTTISNVLRYKMIDTVDATVPLVGDVQMVRTQFEYYDLANSSLPVFVHSTLDLMVFGAPSTLVVVLNSVQPDQTLATASNELAHVSVYPNPATETISVKGLKNDATLSLVDAQGKTISVTEVAPGAASMDVTQVKAGVYFLHIASNDETSVQRVVIR